MIPDRISDSGVVIVDTSPPSNILPGNLWLDPNTNALSVSYQGAWLPAGGGGAAAAPEVFMGNTAPGGTSSYLIWIDNSASDLVVHYKVGSIWVQSLDGGRF